MIWERCCIQTVRLVFNYSKFINDRSRGIIFVAYNRNVTSKQVSSVCTFVHKKMYSTSSNFESKKYENKLAFEKSSYLLRHATNPVNWYPWGKEALEKAKREDKLIFLSVGYSTSIGCHVMEKEYFQNLDIARIMNRYFVNIKVDKEERPDIGQVYMYFIRSLFGHGGWPMNVFLTPTLTPITGGTYLPPIDRYSEISFARVLQTVASQWCTNKQKIINSGSKIFEILQQTVEWDIQIENNILTIECAKACIKQLIIEFETELGGFSKAPKFPVPVNFNLLFLMYARDPEGQLGKKCLAMCIDTLIKMANGGIHDHVGQGFARPSVDRKWHVPHFEKMLCDQGQLLRSYADAYVASNDLFFAEIIKDIVNYVVRDLRHPEGGFYNAEDSSSLPTYDDIVKKEGAFYVWTYEELKSLLDIKISDKRTLTMFDVFRYHFNIQSKGNVNKEQDPYGHLENQNVLIVFGSIAETAERFKLNNDTVKNKLQESLNILFEERNKRPRPNLDNKIVTASNGLMISGLSRAASALDDSKYIEYAENIAKFIKQYLYDHQKKVLLRTCYSDKENKIERTNIPIKGYQVDYAFVIRGLLDLYKVNFDPCWLEFAEQLQDIQDSLFWDDKNGGYFTTSGEDVSVIMRLKEEQDGNEPSGNSIACRNLIELASYLDRIDLFDKASQLLKWMEKFLIQFPAAFPELIITLVNFIDSFTQIYIIGKKDAEDTKKLLKTVQKKLLPGKIIMLADGEKSKNILYRKNKVIDKMKQQNGRATAYVCHHYECSLPVTDPVQLALLLDRKN